MGGGPKKRKEEGKKKAYTHYVVVRTDGSASVVYLTCSLPTICRQFSF